MRKKGNISLEGYRKNSPDRFNDFNIIPSNEISMQNVNKNVLMIPMGGRGTGNPILAKPGERYFFPNHDFVFEQAMPENAIMRYQRIMRNGGPLPKAQMYNSQVGVPLNTNDFIYTPQELEKYKNIYDQRIANCKKGDAACLEQANNYYNMYVAPKLNAPSTWDIAEKMGITTGPNNPRVKEYGTAADSWDLPGLYKQSGAKVNLAAPIKNPSEIQNKLASMSDEDLKKYWINMNLPLGALVNFGQAGLDEHYGKGQAYNISQGLVPSNHSARVSGYSPEGVPYIYDYGRITPITDPTFKSMPLTTITSPKEIQGYTFENLKKQGKLEGSKMNPLKISTKDADYDPDEYEPFIASLQKNKDLYANALNMSDEEYNNYAKHAAALALTETKGGDDLSIRWWHGFLPTLSYVTDKLGLGDTKGITQINPNVLFNKKSLADKLESLGIRKDNYDPWNPDHAAIATMALLKDNRAVQDKHAKTAGNKADLSEAEKTYYQWSMPRTLRIGDAKGESAKIKKYLENYNKIQADFDAHNRYLAENRKFGGDLHKAQDGRIQAATTYASGKEQNYMSPERRAYEQSLANQLAERELRNTKGIADMAGLVFYPAALANATYDASQGNYGQAALSAFPWFKMAKGATKGGLKVAFANTGALSAAKDASEIYNTNPYGLIHKKKGGALPNKHQTNKNIKSSINNLMRRNETLFGPAGRNFYNPNPMSKYYKGGIAFPQAPTAGDTPGQQESEFYPPNWIPPGPVGFYEHGGIAYPQQPTNDYFFSGSPWMPHYDMGGGLPGGANNMYMPCMNCGGYMEDGGMYYANMGINMTSNYGTTAVTDKKMTPQEWSAYNKKMGYTEIPGSSTYKKYYNAQEYTPDENFTFTKVGDVGKNVDYSNDPTYKPLIEYGYKEEQKPIQTKQSRVIPELSNRREIDTNPYFKTYKGPDNKLSYYDMQSNQAIDPTKSFEGGKYKASFLNSPVIAKQRYGGFQEGGFMSPDNMMDYPIFSQGGDPYGYADGGINNPGFRALPENVQQKIISNMQDGGNVLGLDQDQITRTLGQNFMSGVQGNMSPNLMREAVTQYVQNPFDMPQGEYGYNMNTPNMTNANNMYAAQQRMNELSNKNSRIGSDIYNTGMFALGTANEYTKYKAKKVGKGTLPGTPDMTTNQGVGNTTDQSAQTGMARYGAAYIPKAQAGFNARQMKAAGIPELTFPSAPSASTSANPNNLSPEALAKKQAFYDDMAAYDQRTAMLNQMPRPGGMYFTPEELSRSPLQQAGYPNMMGQQGQFAPNFQGMYDMFGNDAYRVGRMGRGMRNMLPYMMFNPQNTYLQETEPVTNWLGRNVGTRMKFRTVFDPRTGKQVQVPVETKEVAKDSKSKMTNQEGRSAQKDYEDMNLFERMRSNRQAKRMMREDERRFKGAKGSSNDEEDFIKQAMEEEARREKKWGVQKAIPENDTRQAYTPRDVFGTLSPNLSTGPLDQNKMMMESLNARDAERGYVTPADLRDPLSDMPAQYFFKGKDGHEYGSYETPYDFQGGYGQIIKKDLEQQRYGGMYEEGGIHELSEDEINQILAAGGSVTYID